MVVAGSVLVVAGDVVVVVTAGVVAVVAGGVAVVVVAGGAAVVVLAGGGVVEAAVVRVVDFEEHAVTEVTRIMLTTRNPKHLLFM